MNAATIDALARRLAARVAQRAASRCRGRSLATVVEDRSDLPRNYVAGSLIYLNDNGAWSWYMDDRAVVHNGKLVVGSVRSTGAYQDRDDPNWGNIEVAAYDLISGTSGRTVLHRQFEQDDHASPAFLELSDGRLLAVYTKHDVECRIYARCSGRHDPLTWGPVQEIVPTDPDDPALRRYNVTYSNPFRLPSGRILNFFRGLDRYPAFVFSDDEARTWHDGGRLLRGRSGAGPYLKYAIDARGAIHFIATEDHPRRFDNGIYHGVIRDGNVCLSDGAILGPLGGGTGTEVAVRDLTRVFRGDADHVAWVTALELDRHGFPRVVFSVQRDGRDLPTGQGGRDHRFYYGRWTGSAWRVDEIAYAGTRLYPGEDDYTGLAALDRNDPDVVYISTDADPTSGDPLVSDVDGRRHHELYRGMRPSSGATWCWEPITAHSAVDNLRPIVPKWPDARTVLVWMRGGYRDYHGPWTTAVVATLLPPSPRRRPKSDNA
jgi:hypothetical protein